MDIRLFKDADRNLWDSYVHAHPDANLYHLSGWKRVIEKTYGHKAYYLVAVKDGDPTQHSALSTHL